MAEMVKCPKCQAEIKPDETFCPACGTKLVLTADEKREKAASIGMKMAKQVHKGKIKSGRIAIMAVAILIVINGFVAYFTGKGEVERELAKYKGNLYYDQDKIEKAETKAKKIVLLISGIFFLLAGIYVGLWFWAKTQPFPASLIALFLYLAIWGLAIAVDPTFLFKGIIINIIIVLALINAVSSAYKHKKLTEANI